MSYLPYQHICVFASTGRRPCVAVARMWQFLLIPKSMRKPRLLALLSMSNQREHAPVCPRSVVTSHVLLLSLAPLAKDDLEICRD
jgi:hypothetical protein